MHLKKRAPLSKHWVFTLNNPCLDDLVVEPPKDDSPFEYLIMGKEVGENGTPHLQGYCVFKNRKCLSGAKKVWPRAHLEIKRGTCAEAINYCKKDDDWDEWGEAPEDISKRNKRKREEAFALAKEGKIEDIPADMRVRYYHAFKRIQQDYPIKPKDLKAKHNYWVLAPSQYGKSTYARNRWPDYFDKAPNKWFIGYEGQQTVLLDDFGPRQCMYLGWYMKRWADLFSFPIETKGGGHQVRPKRIVVTSQYTIKNCFPDELECEAIENRFTVINLLHWKHRIKINNV